MSRAFAARLASFLREQGHSAGYLAVALAFVAAYANREPYDDAHFFKRVAVNALKSLGDTLGVLQQVPRAYLQGGSSALDEARIAERIAARAAAKAERDFARADQIRQDLLAQGIVLQDSASGTTWVKA